MLQNMFVTSHGAVEWQHNAVSEIYVGGKYEYFHFIDIERPVPNWGTVASNSSVGIGGAFL